MNLGPYTYVTLSLHPGESPTLDISFHTPDLWIRHSVIKDERPCLSLGTREATVTVSTTGGGRVTDADLATARKLATVAAQYLADCEHLHTTQTAPNEAA